MNKFNNLLSVPVVALSALLLVGCNSDDTTPNDEASGADTGMDVGSEQGTGMAVIAAVGSLWDSSSISIVEDSNSAEDIVNGYAATDQSDMVVATYGNHFYRIGRFGQDNITKYAFDAPAVPLWQFSVNSGDEQSNPYDLVFVNEEKAYVVRYGAASIWIVNPSVSAQDEDNFKIGEIDLSAYDADGVPNMNAAVLVDGVLYVTMQAMDASYVPGQAYLAGIDTSTDQQINLSGNESLPGIALTVKNPDDLEYANGALYVAGIGRYASAWSGTPAEFSGGIEKISLSDFSSTLILDDGDAENHPYGNITGVEIVSDSKAVFTGYTDSDDISVYLLDLTSNTVAETTFAGLASMDIRALEVDDNNRLWVGIAGDEGPRVEVIDVESQTVVNALTMVQNPTQIVFGKKSK